MDFTALRYFFETAKTGSIRQAAEHLHVAPSAISRQIAKLEHELAAPLFERRSSGVKLTAAGELLADQLQSTVRDILRVRGQIDELKGLRRGRVTIYSIEGLIDSLVTFNIAKFSFRYPDIQFDVTVASTDRIIEALVAGDADIGITLNAPHRAEVSICCGWEEPLHAIVAPAHTLSDRKSISLEELTTYPAALPDRTFGVRRQVDAMLARTGLKPHILVTTNSILATICVARQGVAYTLMPMFAVACDYSAGTLRAVPLIDRELEQSKVAVCVHRSRRLSLAAREFLAWLEASIPATTPPPAFKPFDRPGLKRVASPAAVGRGHRLRA
jgi:DNA-binding transcriptional LysR family regulator